MCACYGAKRGVFSNKNKTCSPVRLGYAFRDLSLHCHILQHAAMGHLHACTRVLILWACGTPCAVLHQGACRQACRRADRHACVQASVQAYRPACKRTGQRAGRHAGRQAGVQAGKQAGRQACRAGQPAKALSAPQPCPVAGSPP